MDRKKGASGLKELARFQNFCDMSQMFLWQYWVKPSLVGITAMHIIVPSTDNTLVPQNNQYCPFACLSRGFQVAVSKERNLSQKF